MWTTVPDKYLLLKDRLTRSSGVLRAVTERVGAGATGRDFREGQPAPALLDAGLCQLQGVIGSEEI